MPELFGSPYILPAIIVILIVLLLLLFLSMRSRKRGETGVAGSKPAKVRGRRGKSTPAPLDAADDSDATAYSDASPETAGEPPVEGQAEQEGGAPSKSRRRSTAPQARTDLGNLGTGGMPSADPITTIVNDVLRGWGDLTTEDTNRLAIFRADKVSAVIAATELPKDLKNSEHARTRLGQLKHYGTSLQEGERPFHAAPRAEFAAIGLGAPEAPSGEMGQPSVPVDEAEHGETAAEMAGEVEETAGEARAADASWGVEKKSNLWDEQPATDLWGSETAETAQDADTDAAPGERGLPKIGWEPAEAPPNTEAPKAAGWDNAESAVAAAAAAFWAVSEAPASKETVTEEELPVVEEMVVQEELAVQEEEITDFEETTDLGESAAPAGPIGEAAFAEPESTDSFFQTLGEKVTTAEHLLALPAAEQETMLVFLEPAELNKVFRATGDPEIKKAIIDTLEHVGSPASLDIIQQCLEDPDPSVQMRALEAADRLLGSSK